MKAGKYKTKNTFNKTYTKMYKGNSEVKQTELKIQKPVEAPMGPSSQNSIIVSLMHHVKVFSSLSLNCLLLMHVAMSAGKAFHIIIALGENYETNADVPPVIEDNGQVLFKPGDIL